MDANSPLVTIVIIAYNEEKYVSSAIESVLNQTYQNIEIILVDDGSKDNTVKLAHEFGDRVKVISQENSGGCSSPRNTGIAHATGSYIGFLDADDLFTSNKIERQVAIFQQYPESVAVVANYCNFRDEQEYADHFSTCPLLLQKLSLNKMESIEFAVGESALLMIDENFTIATSPLFELGVIRSYGGFSEDLKACEDFHLNYRVARDHKISVVSDVLFKRRLHATNMSSNSVKMLRYYCQSRLDLLSNEHELDRKYALKQRVRSYLREYLKTILKTRAWGQLQPAMGIVRQYFFA